MRKPVERPSHRRDRTGGAGDPLFYDDGEGPATRRRLPRQSAVIARHRIEPEPGQGCFPAPAASDKPSPGSRRRFTAKAKPQPTPIFQTTATADELADPDPDLLASTPSATTTA